MSKNPSKLLLLENFSQLTLPFKRSIHESLYSIATDEEEVGLVFLTLFGMKQFNKLDE